ncbi:MAG: hypothetical protein ACMG6S_14015 [Byssovorax sp.]
MQCATTLQSAPVQPVAQVQVKLLPPSVQEPPFWQGLLLPVQAPATRHP